MFEHFIQNQAVFVYLKNAKLKFECFQGFPTLVQTLK